MQGSDTAVFWAAGEWLGAVEEARLLGARGQALAELTEAARSAADARTPFAGALAVSGQIKSLFVALSPLVVLGALLAAGRPPSAAEVARLLLVMPLLMSRLEAVDALRTGLKERASLLEATAHLLALPPHPPPPAEGRRIGTSRACPRAISSSRTSRSLPRAPPRPSSTASRSASARRAGRALRGLGLASSGASRSPAPWAGRAPMRDAGTGSRSRKGTPGLQRPGS